MLLALLLATAFHATPVDWSGVDINIHKLDPPLAPAAFSAAKIRALRPLLRATLGQSWPGCGSEGDQFNVYRTPLGPRIFKVEAGRGGCRGGQGSNGALWLIQRQGSSWRVLASPAVGFNGWGFGIQPRRTNGLPDLITGWHMGASDFVLTYFRFDGSRYLTASTMEFKPCSEKEERFCMSDGRPARNTGPPE